MKVKIKVIKKHGKSDCPRMHEVGDEFFIEEGKTPINLCGSAFNSLWPFVRVLLITKDKNHECSVICPDGILEYELKIVE